MRCVLLPLAFAVATPAVAAETITYTYDTLGRLVTVNHSGSINDGVKAQYNYDPASNRSSVAVTGVKRPIVVPLNGLTLIPVSH